MMMSELLLQLSQRFVSSIGNIEKNYVSFQLSGQAGLFLLVLEISALLLTYPCLKVFFSCFHRPKKYKIRASAHSSVRFIKIKVKQRSILALKWINKFR